MSLKKIDDIKDFSKLGFHFSDGEEKINSIEETGLKPDIGDNSATFEATPKISFSLGLDGLLQTANRFLNLAQTMNVSFFQNDTHKKYLPDIAQNDPNYKLTTLEALEFMKKYFENSSYFVFDAPASKYEHEITNNNLDKANQEIKEIQGLVPINDNGEIFDINYNELNGTYNFGTRLPKQNEPQKNLYKEIEKIRGCLAKNYNSGKANFTPQQLKEYELLLTAKNKTIIKIMELTTPTLQRGNLVEDGLFDTFNFHEQKLKWRKQSVLNTQSKVDIQDGETIGKGIEPEDLSILSVDGVSRANNLEVLNELYSRTVEKTTTAGDIDMIGLLLEYSNIPENGINQYMDTHPQFGYQIISAQNHAKSMIEKQEEYEKKVNVKPKNEKIQNIPQTSKRTVHDDTDYSDR